MNPILEHCRQNLIRRGFDARIVSSAEEARQILWEEIQTASPESISFGDSRTVEATGILDQIRRDDRYRLLDGFDRTMPRAERLEIRRQGLLCDLFISGVNALTQEGALLWLDMIGNRIAPIAFGPRKVLLVVGRNKITATRQEAEERIHTVAAPQNVARHPGFRTPCAKTGVCSDCSSEDRICNTHMRMERCYPHKRITVVLIDEDLGL